MSNNVLFTEEKPQAIKVTLRQGTQNRRFYVTGIDLDNFLAEKFGIQNEQPASPVTRTKRKYTIRSNGNGDAVA